MTDAESLFEEACKYERTGEYAAPRLYAIIGQLVAEVRRLRDNPDVPPVHVSGWIPVPVQNAPRWTTTPPGPEHEGRWFWVKSFASNVRCASLHFSEVDPGVRRPWFDRGSFLGDKASDVVWAGPIEEPVE